MDAIENHLTVIEDPSHGPAMPDDMPEDIVKVLGKKCRTFYQVSRNTNVVGISADNQLVTGLVIEFLAGTGHDMLDHEIVEGGGESIELPETLSDGDVLEVIVQVRSTDWETGYPEDWDVTLVPVTDTETLKAVASLAMLCYEKNEEDAKNGDEGP